MTPTLLHALDRRESDDLVRVRDDGIGERPTQRIAVERAAQIREPLPIHEQPRMPRRLRGALDALAHFVERHRGRVGSRSFLGEDVAGRGESQDE